MGKSDPFVFQWYSQNLPKIEPKNIAILGSTTESFVRNVYPGAAIDLYDVQIKNWEINSDWRLKEDFYDLVVCTRCAYFSKDPDNFIKKSLRLLKDGGFLFVDWGLGDHWRFKNYKVGWLKDEEHEFAYFDQNFLWSAVWSHSLLKHPQVQIFADRIKNYGYSDLEKAAKAEVPSLYQLDESKETLVGIDALALWEENPQLYILTIFQKG